MSRRPPPEDFAEDFFAWLDEVSEELMVEFFPRGGVAPGVLAELESRLCMKLPKQLQSLYRHFNPWGVKADWAGWEEMGRLRDRVDISAPFAPIDCSGYSSTSVHTAAALDAGNRFRVIRYNFHRQEAVLHVHVGDLRSYVLLLVAEEE